MDKIFNKTVQGETSGSNHVGEVVILSPGEQDAKYLVNPSKKKVFDDFAERERKIANDMGVTTLEHAESAKHSAERNVQMEARLFEEYTQKVEKLRDEIEAKKSNIITRIFEFRKIRELQKELDFRERVASRSEDVIAKKKELVDAYGYLLSEEQTLAVIIDEANKENKEWDERKKRDFLEDEKRRTIGDLANRHGVFFVHDIVDAEWKPSGNNNAINTKNLDFLNQLDIVLGLDPTISVSTLKSDTKQYTFGQGSWGVFLSGGRVIGGEPSDAATIAYGLRNRKMIGGDANKTIQGIDVAISGDGRYITRERGYNELVVENPEVAGVYLKWGTEGWPVLKEGEDILLSQKERGDRRDRYTGWWERISAVLKRGAPVFVIDQKNNHVRMLYDINVAEKTFKVTPEYDPSNMVDMPGIYKQHLGKTEKKQAIMRVFDKVTGLISEEEREQYLPNDTEQDSRGVYSVH